MAQDWPKITARRNIPISPWMTVVERTVEFADGAAPEIYHAVGQQDYIAIVARTPEGLIPIVRQYRPALERRTWEFPAGLVDPGEAPIETCRRELLEETGLSAKSIHPLGTLAPCTARLSNQLHSFFVDTERCMPGVPVEQGIEVRFLSPRDLGSLIRSGEFVLQLHVGALMLAALEGHLEFDAFAVPPTD
jgi:ADP-ribose pyrophosphatase